jgi:hypothetical protein
VIERTEELGLAARLPISVGGQLVQLRTLNLDESERWLGKVSAAVARLDVPDTGNPATVLADLAKQPAVVMLELVRAYDVENVLGTATALRKRMTQRELYDAVKQMVRAEAPFLEDARSVVEAFGPQLRAMAAGLLYRMSVQSQPANSTNGRSLSGASTPDNSELVSPKSGS